MNAQSRDLIDEIVAENLRASLSSFPRPEPLLAVTQIVGAMNAAILAANPVLQGAVIMTLASARDHMVLDEAVRLGLATEAQISVMAKSERAALIQRVTDMAALPDWKDRHAHRNPSYREVGHA